MHSATLISKDDQRRAAVRHKNGWNGLDYLDVSEDQRTLTVYFLGKAPAQLLRQEGEDGAAYKTRLRQYVHIEGGRRVRNIAVTDVAVQQARDPKTRTVDPERDDWMVVRLDKYGDFSTYTLRLTGLENIDPRYDHIDFSFKVDCPSDLDCAPAEPCPPARLDEPYIDYLAKDYASFRQLILDRLVLVMPDWKERSVPDIGITLVELLAYVGDHLSYYQDAVATEAYLDTARQRISVRRHARLMDYYMHEGCNARTWVCVETDQDLNLDPRQVFFTTRANDPLLRARGMLNIEVLHSIPPQQYEVFEPMTTETIHLYAAHSQMRFYAWGQRESCLPRGATSATLLDAYTGPVEPVLSLEAKEGNMSSISQRSPASNTEPEQSSEPNRQLQLQAGDVLIFEEVIGPRTGNPADANLTHRHAVRLTRVSIGEDPLYDPPVPIVEIEWGQEDALPFALCISAITDAAHGCHYIEDISVVCGNAILVDHGRTLPREDLGIVPCLSSEAECDCAEHPTEVRFTAGRFHPVLAKALLTFRQPLAESASRLPARRMLRQDARRALPQLTELKSIPPIFATDCEELQPLFRLTDLRDPSSLISNLRDGTNPASQVLRARLSPETLELLDEMDESASIPAAVSQALLADLEQIPESWSAQYDLLSSNPDDQHFVVEIDNEGQAHLRFGDEELGRLPQAGSAFFATYRVGNGSAGNVGAEMISHMVLRNSTLSGAYVTVRNPLPAQGGTQPEPLAEVKLFAPFAFRKQLRRAITASDYAELVQRDFREQVQRAAGALTWTGSWYEARVAVDPFGSEEAAAPFLDGIQKHLYRYRRIGHDVGVIQAQYVPLEIEMVVCVLPHYLRGHVEAALRDIFSNRVLPNGRLGFFHPDNLTFGEGIYLSRLVAAAQSVTGVESVTVTVLQRLGEGDNGELKAGVLQLGPLEVARLDNNPSFPEHGKLVLNVGGDR
jgi:hypothetical protein